MSWMDKGDQRPHRACVHSRSLVHIKNVPRNEMLLTITTLRATQEEQQGWCVSGFYELARAQGSRDPECKGRPWFH